MITLPNVLSLLRLPLALLFLQQGLVIRVFAVLLAMLTDVLDGFLARRYQATSRLGTVLDPLMDKFFVLFILGIFLQEERLAPWQAATLLTRDGALLIFGFYLFCQGRLATYRFHAIYCGKLTTFLQFLVLLSLTFGFPVPEYVYLSFLPLGALALAELLVLGEKIRDGMVRE